MTSVLQLLDIDDGFLSLMDDAGNTRDDLKVPEGDIGEEIVREHLLLDHPDHLDPLLGGEVGKLPVAAVH